MEIEIVEIDNGWLVVDKTHYYRRKSSAAKTVEEACEIVRKLLEKRKPK